jgi:hypothetical protein
VSIFISWSGEPSRSYAAILAEWIPFVVPGASVFFSPSIEPGARSFRAIEKALEGCTYGIVCLTRTNLGSPWLNFEAGAMANALRVIAEESDQPPVVPLLFGGLTTADVQTPLSIFFQMRYPDRGSIQDIVRGINKSLGERSQLPHVLDKLFEALWPECEDKIAAVNVDDASQAKPKRDVIDIVGEILDIVRAQQRTAPLIFRGAEHALGAERASGAEQNIIAAIKARAHNAGMNVVTHLVSGDRRYEYDVVVNGDLVIEVKLWRSRADLMRNLHRAYQQALAGAAGLGSSLALVVASAVASADPMRPETQLVELIDQQIDIPFVVYEYPDTFTGNARAQVIAPWLLD